jgi:YHS domain-containing protein
MRDIKCEKTGYKLKTAKYKNRNNPVGGRTTIFTKGMAMNVRNKNLIMFFLMCSLMLTIVSLTGCRKSEPVVPAETKEVVSGAVEQTTCPVMGGSINKEIHTEYKGKKVYFCCPSCKEKFEKEPDKYLSKLPQFQK